MTTKNNPAPLVSVRSALVLATSGFAATWVGVLTYLVAGADPVAGALAATSTFGATVLGLHKVVGSH